MEDVNGIEQYYASWTHDWDGSVEITSSIFASGDYEKVISEAISLKGVSIVWHWDELGYEVIPTDMFYEGVRFSKVGE